MSEIPKKVGVIDSVSLMKLVENYPDFEKLAHVIGSCFSVHYRVMEHVGILESTEEA